MALSNSWRTPDSQSLATDSRYHNYHVLEYLKRHPASTVLTFSPAWIRPHTNVRLVNYMDPEILHLFDSNNILSAEGLRIELQRLGISHIHKDNYFSFPMIYRTSFQPLLSDSRFVKPIVMGPGGNLFQLRSKIETYIPASRCIIYTDQYQVNTRPKSPISGLIGIISQAIGSSHTPRFVTSGFESSQELQTSYLPLEFGSSFNDSLLKSRDLSTNGVIRIDAEILGFGLAKGQIEFSKTLSKSFGYYQPSGWIVFSESRDKNGVIHLSGQIPFRDGSVFRLGFSAIAERLSKQFEVVSLTVCLQG